MPEITRPTVQLSLIITPPADGARDLHTLDDRIARMDGALAAVRELALFWDGQRKEGEGFWQFEAELIEALRVAGRASTELMLALAESRNRRESAAWLQLGEKRFRRTSPEPRSLNTWFGTVRYSRSYMRPVGLGPGWFPLDVDLGLLADRVSPSLLATSARLATRMSFAEAREVLGWFVPQPPSTEVIEQVVLGLGHHTQEWFAHVAPPGDDGEVLVILIDGKCVPTAKSAELEKRRGPRTDKPRAASPRHRGRADRKARGRPPRRKKGDKSKNGKLVTMVVMYTLRREGALLLGPLNRRVYASFGPKRHAFEFAVEEATRRGFGPDTDNVVHLLTDGDPDLHRNTDEYFPIGRYPQRVVTVDVMHVLYAGVGSAADTPFRNHAQCGHRQHDAASSMTG